MELRLQDPTLIAKKHSIKVSKYIKNKIKQRNGMISFSDFMQYALYAPNLGYYHAGCRKFGQGGDFITAPMLGFLFASCVFNQLLEIRKNTDISSNILELGAGDGKLASQLIPQLINNNLFDKYFILEPSYELRHRQRNLLLNTIHSKYIDHIVWLEQLPKHFDGIIIANEVLDALPVKLFNIKNNCIFEKMVAINNSQFIFQEIPANKELIQIINSLPIEINDDQYNNYNSEVCLLLPGLIKSLAQTITKGAILLVDYGFLDKDYYHPDRYLGTLMCHYRHYAHTDPFFLPGLQDITAHVDFSLVIKSALLHQLEVFNFCSLANFLLNNNIQNILEKFNYINTTEQAKLYQELNTLISPQEMGEIFKVLLLIRR